MAEKQERNRDADIDEVVDNMTLMDDDFMSKVFDGNIPATGRLLRTILGREDIEVISVVGQMELQNPLVEGRMIRLDIVAEDRDGVTCDVEVQRKKDGAHPRRARFHSSMMDARMLKAGKEFKELKDSYTIFITEDDYYKKGLPLYTIERQLCEDGEDFNDGSHIIYVNGNYDGDDAIGLLIRDLKCKKAEDMYYPELAEGVRHFKEEKGRDSMCELVENYARQRNAEITAEKEKVEAENEKLEAENEKLEAENEKLEAEKEKVEAENGELRARLAQYETV